MRKIMMIFILLMLVLSSQFIMGFSNEETSGTKKVMINGQEMVIKNSDVKGVSESGSNVSDEVSGIVDNMKVKLKKIESAFGEFFIEIITGNFEIEKSRFLNELENL